MSIVLLHSLWYLLNFLWGLLKPKHFNFKIKHYYSRARKKGNCVLFRSISSESTVSWCVLPSQCCVLQSQLLCTAKLAVVYWKVSWRALQWSCVLQTARSADVYCRVSQCEQQRQLICVSESAVAYWRFSWCTEILTKPNTEYTSGIPLYSVLVIGHGRNSNKFSTVYNPVRNCSTTGFVLR